MTKANLLLVDADPKALRLLETGLRRSGFAVTACRTAEDGEEKALLYPPDLVLMDTHLKSDEDGFELAARLRNNPATADIPVVFVSKDVSVERKVRAVEIGVDVYLAKPPLLAEIIQSIEGCLARIAHERHDPATTTPPAEGSLTERSLIELLQAYERSRSTCELTLVRDRDIASLRLVDGVVYVAHLGELEGASAMARVLTWETGSFHSSSSPSPDTASPETAVPSLDLIEEGLRHLELIERAWEVLPSADRPLDVNAAVLAASLARLPDAVNSVLRVIDGKATLIEVVERTPLPEALALDLCRRLWLAGIVVDAEATLLPTEASPSPDEAFASLEGEPVVDEDPLATSSSDAPDDVPSEENAVPSAEVAPDTAAQSGESTTLEAETQATEEPSAVAIAAETGEELQHSISDAEPRDASVEQDAHSVADTADTVIEPAPPEAELEPVSELPSLPPPAPQVTEETQRPSPHGRRVRPSTSISLAPQGATIADASEEHSTTPPSTDNAAPAGVTPSGRGRFSVAEEDPSAITDAVRDATRHDPKRTLTKISDDDDDLTMFLHPRLWLFTRTQAAGLLAATVTAGATAAWWSRGVDTTTSSPPVEVVFDEGAGAPSPSERTALATALVADDEAPVPPAEEVPAGADAPSTAGVAAEVTERPETQERPAAERVVVPPHDQVTPAQPKTATSPSPPPARVKTTKNVQSAPPAPSVQEKASGSTSPRKATPAPQAQAASKSPASDGESGGTKTTDARQGRYRDALTAAEGHSRAGRWRDAVTSFKLAVEEEPSSAIAHYGLGNAYFELDSVQNALRHLERSRALQGNTPEVHLLLGAVYQTAGRLKEARRSYEKYLQLAPKGKFVRDVNAILETLDE